MTSKDDILAGLKIIASQTDPIGPPSGSAQLMIHQTQKQEELKAKERALLAKEEELKAMHQQLELRNKHIVSKASSAGVSDAKCEEVEIKLELKAMAMDLFNQQTAFDPGNITALISKLMTSVIDKPISGADKKSVVMYVVYQMASTRSNDITYNAYVMKIASNTIDELCKVGVFKPMPQPELAPEFADDAAELESKLNTFLAGKKFGPSNSTEVTAFLMKEIAEKKMEGPQKKGIVMYVLSKVARTAVDSAADYAYNNIFVSSCADSTIETIFKAAGKTLLQTALDPSTDLGKSMNKACCIVM